MNAFLHLPHSQVNTPGLGRRYGRDAEYIDELRQPVNVYQRGRAEQGSRQARLNQFAACHFVEVTSPVFSFKRSLVMRGRL
jgi:hypothetical protein